MSTATLRELIENIKARANTTATATGSSAATPRDLVYLAKSVEALLGADAMLDLVDTASRPAEIVTASAPGTTVINLSLDQITKEVLVVRSGGGSFSASAQSIVTPSKGFSAVVKNELTIPVAIKTSTQTTPVSIAAGQKGWIYCDGTNIEFVVDVAALAAAVQTPNTTKGDITVFDGTQNVRKGVSSIDGFMLKSDSTAAEGVSWQPDSSRPDRFKALACDFIPWDYTTNAPASNGGNAQSATATPRIGNLITDATLFPNHANKGIWDVDNEHRVTYRGSSGVLIDGSIVSWGNNATGRLGNSAGNAEPPFNPVFYKTSVDGTLLAEEEDVKVKFISSNYDRSVVTTTAGKVYVTGYGGHGQNGDGSTSSKNFYQLVTFPAGVLIRYAIVSQDGSATGHVLALTEDGDVYSWGYNANGQLGHGDVTNRTTPAKIAAFNKNVKAIYAFEQNSGAILNDGTPYVWGAGDSGQISNGGTADSTSPYPVSLGGACVKIVFGGTGAANTSVWFLRADGKVYAAGYNGYYQLGDNSATNRTTLVMVNNLGQDANTIVLDMWATQGAGPAVYATTADGRFWSWGHNPNGHLGQGDTTYRAQPTVVTGVTYVSQVISSSWWSSTTYYYNNTVILQHKTEADRQARKNGMAKIAGYQGNYDGNLTNSTARYSFTPVGIPFPYHQKIRRVYAGGFHWSSTAEQTYYFLTSDGIVFSTGYTGDYSRGRESFATGGATRIYA